MKLAAKLLAFAVLASCGPSTRPAGTGSGSGSGSGSNDCPSCAVLTGRVWAPRWAPGDVPPGQEIPIFGAMVYVSATKPDPIPEHVYCSACIDAPQGGVLTGHDGSFTLSVQPGHYWLVVQKGGFRSEREVDLVQGPLALAAADTTLPSRQDPADGQSIPRIAVAYGNFDAVADILAKMGIGTLGMTDKDPNVSGVDNGDSSAELTFYTYGGTSATSVHYLVSNLAEMEKFHIIFFPCSTAVDDTLLSNQTVLKNIRQFVAEGGKIYVTDWSGETADRAFPPQLELGDDGFSTDIDSVGDYDPTALTGTLSLAGTADGTLYTAADGNVVDSDLAAWLGLQVGPDEDDPTPHIYTPSHFSVVDNWNWIKALHSHDKGTDASGATVYDDPKAWVTGSDDSNHGPHPLAVTYEPTGCGKVLYSTFQTSGADATEAHMGLMPQERILLFLIMEISACTQNPVII
jgi:hypothetical protein